jgi:hypothetical protein
MWEAVEAAMIQALLVLIPLATAWAGAWLRARTQRQVVQQAAEEAEAEGHRHGLRGAEKKEMALTLSSTRLGAFTRPSPERLDEMVEDAVPEAKRTVPPPPGD